MRRLITISVLSIITVFGNNSVSAPKLVTTSRELPKVVVRVVKKVVVKPFWFIPLSVMNMWAKVNICEMGGNWKTEGPLYSGGLGITNTNWAKFGGRMFAPNAVLATPMQQVYIARKIENSNYVPDQYGCGQGW